MKELTVVIVSYNVKHYLEQCLRSLQRALDGVDAEVVVVDNHSRDGSVAHIGKRFPRVRLISSAHNLGFARANNIAIRQTESRYVLLLNPDTIVAEDTLRRALDFAHTHPDLGALGVRMLRTDGHDALESRRGLPTPMTACYKMCGLCARFPQSRRFGRYYMAYLPWDEPAEIEVVSGAFCLLARQAIDQVGTLDEDFFMYGEDIDLSCRLLQGGYRNWYLPLPILHYKGESTEHSSFRYLHVFYGAMLIFFRKHYGGMHLLLSVPIKAAICLKACAAFAHIQFERLRKSLGFFNRTRPARQQYIFIGAKADECATMNAARRKALDAVYVAATPADLDSLDAATLCQNATARDIYLAYNTDTFAYADILCHMQRMARRTDCPQLRLQLATYHPKTRTIITAEDVLK